MPKRANQHTQTACCAITFIANLSNKAKWKTKIRKY